MQRIAAEISARLAQVAKDPPDLAAYLRVHAECVTQLLQPVGLAYEMASGQSFQRAYAQNHDSLRLRESPAQEAAFQRAIRSAAEQAKPVFLEANMRVPDAARGGSPDDVPAPETLPLHNQTPFQQVFVPIPLNKRAVGVLHAWFNPAESNGSHARVALTAHAASEIELYLKARRITDISQELGRINTYARFLEDVAGDQELDSVSWKLVNYAREAVGCDRVCLFVDSRYGVAATNGLPPSKHFELQACSGLRRPHARSEHAEVLKAHAAELLKLAVGATPVAEPRKNGAAAVPAEAAPQDSAAERTPEAEKDGDSAPKKPKSGAPAVPERPKMRIIFTMRDPSKTPTRPEAVNRYFDVIPMNWSTALPLYDRENRVCGTLLFEGQQRDDKMAALFMQMRDLAVSGGRALSTALVWHRRRALRGARVLMRWRDALLATSRRRVLIKYGVPILLLIALLAFPFPYRIRGDATLRPVNIHTVAALTSGRLMEVNAREGDRVTKGQVLCVLDSTDLQLQRRQAQQDRERAATEAQLAQREGSEARMQIARLAAQKADALVEKLTRDIELTIIRAPFDGILLGPQDLTQRRGQVVKVGETIAEIVDPSRWEVKVSVREQDVPTLIDEVERRKEIDPAAGVEGELILAAHPELTYPLKLTDPSGFAHRLDTTGGKYSFSAILPLSAPAADAAELAIGSELKSGYTGRARFTCGRRPLAAILFGDFVRFVKLAFF